MDEILSELRAIREGYAQKFNYNVFAMWRDIKEEYEKSGRRGVTFPPKQATPAARKQELPKLEKPVSAE